jgi:hypothetical protein
MKKIKHLMAIAVIALAPTLTQAAKHLDHNAFMDEQLFWARQLQSLGLAGKPLPAKYVSANTLAQAIQNVLNDGSYYNTAQKVSPTMQK